MLCNTAPQQKQGHKMHVTTTGPASAPKRQHWLQVTIISDVAHQNCSDCYMLHPIFYLHGVGDVAFDAHLKELH